MAPASFHGISNTVCVMDASTRLGSSLVKRLLARGYTVHAAIQNIHHGDHDEFLELSGLGACDMKRLKNFHLDLFDYHSIVDALKGCSGLFYSFEPPKDHSCTYDEYMGEVEVRAAHNVLEACAQIDTVEKVVFTSSATAIIWGHENDQNSASMHLDERHWSDINFCRKFKLWHALSKTLAEKTAWALAMDRGINMVSINAGLVMGPDLTVTNPYLKGAAEMYEDGVFVTVDLDYLVEAHICVYEDISTYGRYLCFNHIINQNEDAIKLAKMLSSLPSSPQSLENDTRIIPQRISNKKLNKLMVECQPPINDLMANQEECL
ncbi:cinnamoyl-CoA reductase-like SNL6 [Capsicum galapagoense]